MSAIITSQFRLENANNFIASTADVSNSVYVFIGKSDAWSTSKDINTDSAATTPLDTISEINDAWQNMIAMKKVNSSQIINLSPRHNWTSGLGYTPWDDGDNDIFTKEFYAITDEFKVYKCIRAGTGASVNKPTHTELYPQFEADGYLWKYMFTISLSDGSKFLTNFYIPVKTVIDDGDLNDEDQIKFTNQQQSIANLNGKIYRYKVLNGGAGYSQANPPTVIIRGNGTAAAATATVDSSGVITDVRVRTSSGTFEGNAGSGYTVAFVELNTGVYGGSGAIIQPVLSPAQGHGSDPVKELGAFFIGINVRLEEDDGSGDFIVENSFRQIGIIKNPKTIAGAAATEQTYSALKTMTFGSTVDTGIQVTDYIVGQDSGAIAFVDAYDVPSGQLKYHQNDKTGYTAFMVDEFVNGTGDVGEAEIVSLGNPEVQRFSGEILFLENRKAINRTLSQIEDVKIIIEF
jgi:hypothetical protein